MIDQNYDYFYSGDIIQEVERKLDELKPFQYDSRYRMLLGDNFVRRISQWERNIRNRKDDPFTLVVCGEFKRGKSSLINAILGEDVVTTNVTSETVTLNRITYGPHENEVVFVSGRRVKIADEEMNRDALEARIEKTGEKVLRMEIRRPIDLLKKITIVDTPGLADAMEDFTELVEYSLQQADAVIYVFNTMYPLSRTEQLFLKTRILPQKYTDLFLVANYADMLPDKEGYEKMRTLLQQRMEDILPGRQALMLSALDERCLQCGEDRPNRKLKDTLAENFQSFRGQLEELIEQKQYMVLPDRMNRLLRAMGEDLEGILSSVERGLDMSEQDVKEDAREAALRCEGQLDQQKQLHSRIREQILQMRQECQLWMDVFMDRMERELDNLTGVSSEDLEKHYSFYSIDMIQMGLEKCIDCHKEILYDVLDDISFELTKSLTKVGENKQYQFRFALDNQTWTKGDNISYVASYLSSGLLSLISDGITGAMREKEMAEQTPDMLNRIRRQYLLLRNSVEEAVGTAYEKLLKTVLDQLDAYHDQQLRTYRDQVEQSALIARQNAQEKEEIREIVVRIREILRDIA